MKKILKFKKNSGFILITGLIILLIMTLIILYSMATSVSQEKTSGGLEDKNVSLQNAETALRYAENYLFNTNVPSSSFNTACTGGLCLPVTSPPQQWQSITWATDTTHTISLPAGTVPNTPIQPKFIIELLGDAPVPAGESMKMSSNNNAGAIYRITTVAFGNRNATMTQLQETYVKR